MMKRLIKLLILSPLMVCFSGCYSSYSFNNIEIPDIESSSILQACFVYYYRQDSETHEYYADIFWEYSYYNIDNFPQRDVIVAGDQLELVHTGFIQCEESFPGNCYIQNGEILNYRFIDTTIKTIHSDDKPIKEIANEIRDIYSFSYDYVVLNTNGNYVDIDEYEGHDLYLSIDQKKETNKKESASNITFIAGLYAYNPR